MRPVLPLLLATVLLPLAPASATPAPSTPRTRPPVDVEAMREASSGRGVTESYASARAMAHYLAARRFEHQGDVPAALEELRLAVVYDDRSAELRVAVARLQARLGLLDRAELELRRALVIEPRRAEAHLLLGRVLAAQRRGAEALGAFERSVALEPASEEACLALLRQHLEAGNPAAAEGVVRRCAAAFAGRGEPFRILARAADERGRTSEAERLLRAAVAAEPGDVGTWLQLAQRGERRGARAQARADYEAALRQEPEQADALVGAMRLALRAGDDVAARGYAGRLVGASEDGAHARIRAALVFLEADRPLEALPLLDAALARAPEDPRIRLFRGMARDRVGRSAEALEDFFEVPSSAAPLRAEARGRAAATLSRERRHDEAVATLERALEEVSGPARTPLLAYAPDVYRRAARSTEGVARLSAIAELEPGPASIVSVARALLDVGEIDEAIARLRAAFATWPDDERLAFALATAHERRDDVDAAVAVMRRVLARAPDHAGALNFIGYLWADRGVRLDEARMLHERAVAIEPDEGAYLDSLGWLHARRGDLRAAVPLLERADVLLRGDPTVLDHLAEVYARLGRRADAMATWRRALDGLDREPDPMVRAAVERKLHAIEAGSASR